MKILEEYNSDQSDLIEIKSADYMGDFAIRINFSDGVNKMVDFKSFLEASSHPSIRKYLSENMFKQFVIMDGNLNWNDYDLIFPIYDLYLGKIHKKD
ncbi:MAG: DUF2442 domain-containing protein [Flavobacteriales bacterium]